MSEKVLFCLDAIFVFFGGFWAGLVFFRALPLEYGIVDWVLIFSVIAIFLYPLIRKIVEFLVETNWEDFKYFFKGRYEDRGKKRWDY